VSAVEELRFGICIVHGDTAWTLTIISLNIIAGVAIEEYRCPLGGFHCVTMHKIPLLVHLKDYN
jgi:hypothetical protein